eukprot:scaffold132956_cov19-Tisochrysis_lutea.AAC.1
MGAQISPPHVLAVQWGASYKILTNLPDSCQPGGQHDAVHALILILHDDLVLEGHYVCPQLQHKGNAFRAKSQRQLIDKENAEARRLHAPKWQV